MKLVSYDAQGPYFLAKFYRTITTVLYWVIWSQIHVFLNIEFQGSWSHWFNAAGLSFCTSPSPIDECCFLQNIKRANWAEYIQNIWTFGNRFDRNVVRLYSSSINTSISANSGCGRSNSQWAMGNILLPNIKNSTCAKRKPARWVKFMPMRK